MWRTLHKPLRAVSTATQCLEAALMCAQRCQLLAACRFTRLHFSKSTLKAEPVVCKLRRAAHLALHSAAFCVVVLLISVNLAVRFAAVHESATPIAQHWVI